MAGLGNSKQGRARPSDGRRDSPLRLAQFPDLPSTMEAVKGVLSQSLFLVNFWHCKFLK